MTFHFEASNDAQGSFLHIDTLIGFAIQQRDNGIEENRMLFLKLSVVSAVTKFQVFIENILKEYQYKLKNNQKKHCELSTHLRLNAIKLFATENIIHKSLENYEAYSSIKLNEIKRLTQNLLSFCDDNLVVDSNFMFETKFPLGKNGVNELIKLFRQVNGDDIFANPPFDKNKLNEILSRRHAIIHEDSNPQITEQIVQQYKDYLLLVIKYVDDYMKSHL